MEKKTTDIKEALTYMFKGEKPLKIFYGLLFWLPAMFIQVILQNKWLGQGVLETIYLTISFIIIGIFGYAFMGYFVLYAHDRALDRNAKFRDWSECFWDAFFAGLKWYIGFACILCASYIVMIPITIILTILGGLLMMLFPPLAFILGIPLGIVLLVLWLQFFFKLNLNFIKDLKVSSWFKWKTAFGMSKGIKYGKDAIIIGLLLFILYCIVLFVPLIVFGMFSFGSTQVPTMPPLVILPAMIIFLYTSLYWNSVFGQTTYHAIEQNMGVEPETLSKEINKDKVISIILAIVVFIVMLVPSLIFPSLLNRQNDIMAKTKIKKAAANYQMVTSMYMAQSGQQNLSGMMGHNCQNASNYFMIKEQNGCNFVTGDGVYWQFSGNDGSAVVSDNALKPTMTVKMGMCYDGSINCQYDYPEVWNLINGSSSR